jgi:chromodomain helicase DNA binding protein 8
MILSDCPELREISWRCVIIDEAHRLKNRNCKLLDSLKMLDLVSNQGIDGLRDKVTNVL